MSGKQSGLVWEIQLTESRGVSKDAKRNVLLAMADHADHEGNNVFPSIGLLAWKTELSTRQVVRVIKALMTENLVRLEQENFGKYRTRLYSLHLENAQMKTRYTGRASLSPCDTIVSSPPVTSDVIPPCDMMVSPNPSELNPSDKTISNGVPSLAAQKLFNEFNKKRWKTNAQRELFEKTELEVGSQQMMNAVIWACQKGISDIHSICTAARKNKKTKSPISNQQDIVSSAQRARKIYQEMKKNGNGRNSLFNSNALLDSISTTETDRHRQGCDDSPLGGNLF